jgi:hypothetical protein
LGLTVPAEHAPGAPPAEGLIGVLGPAAAAAAAAGGGQLLLLLVNIVVIAQPWLLLSPRLLLCLLNISQ